MKDLRTLDKYRNKALELLFYGTNGDDKNGLFEIKIDGVNYTIIASNGDGWEHVSVSSEKFIPSWEAMCKVKEMFFEDEEVVVQYHPKKSEYVNNHPNCLHLWRPTLEKMPTPPMWMVGVKTGDEMLDNAIIKAIEEQGSLGG